METGHPGASEREHALEGLVALVLREPAEFTREEVAAALGITVAEARTYWRAMGFADVGDRRAFTRADVESLRVLLGWVESGLMDQARVVEIVRSLGQSTARLADWQVSTMARVLAETESPVALDDVLAEMATMLPEAEYLLVHAWRRNLAAVIGRGLAGVDELAERELGVMTVGFADIAGFTRLSRVMAEEELAAMVESFETGAADIVATHGARLVKTLGDEVMFVASTADEGVAIAAAMHRLRGPIGAGLRLRIGLATGRLVAVMGDYYGDTVNRASRLTAIARPGSTMIDPATEEALSSPRSHVVRHHRPRTLRGLGVIRAASVRPRMTRPRPTS